MGRWTQSISIPYVFNIGRETGRELKLCHPSASADILRPSDGGLGTGRWWKLTGFSPSTGPKPCPGGDRGCLDSSCVESCAGSSLCDSDSSLSNCSKYNSRHGQFLRQTEHPASSYPTAINSGSWSFSEKAHRFAFAFVQSLHVVAERNQNGLH